MEILLKNIYIVCFVVLIGQKGYSQLRQTVILKDGQNIALDSFKLFQRDCKLSIFPIGIRDKFDLCLENVLIVYDKDGSTMVFRPCDCQNNFIDISKPNIKKPIITTDVIISHKGVNIIADAGSIEIDTKKLKINFLENKKKKNVKYCDIKEIHFSDGRIQTIDESLCKPKKS